MKALACTIALLHAAAGLAGELPRDVIARTAAGAEAPLLDRALFLDTPRSRTAALSPDGEKVVYLSDDADGTALWRISLASGQAKRLGRLKDVDAAFWSEDGSTIFLETRDGIAAMPAAGGRPALITRLGKDAQQFLIGVDRTGPAHLLLAAQVGDDVWTLLRIGADGSRTVLLQDSRRIHAALLDHTGRPAFIRQAVGAEQIVYRLDASGKRELLRCDFLDACELLHHDPARDSLLMVTSRGSDFRRLVSIDTTRGHLRELHADPARMAGISDVQLDAAGRVLLASYYGHRLRHYPLDHAAAPRLAGIVQQFPDSDVWIDAPDKAGYWLLRVKRASLDHEGLYVLNPGNEIEPLPVASASRFAEQQLARKLPFSYTATDGMRLHAYLSLPAGTKAASVPLVVKVHGGPWNRVDGSFDPVTQFLVNRGYAVFEPNFRSSTGYSTSYVTRADGDYGDGRVQQDIVDGVQWLLAQGIGDRQRLGIVGHSFGGFSVLAGLAFTPDLFRAGFAGAPPSDFVRSARLLIEQESDLANGVGMDVLMRELLIDIDDVEAVARLTANSPRENAAAIRQPLVIWAGGRDQRVDVREVKHFALGLEQADKAVTLLVDPAAGHGPREDLQLEAYLWLMEELLARQLGGRRQAEISARLSRYLESRLVFDRNQLQPQPSRG